MTDQHLVIPYHIQFFQPLTALDFHTPTTENDRCMLVVLAGCAKISQVQHGQNSTFSVGAGDVFIMPATALCSVAQCDQLHLAVVWYHSSRMNSFVGAFKQMSGYQALFSIYPTLELYTVPTHRVQCNATLCARLTDLLQSMEAEYSAKEDGYHQIMNSLFFVMVTLLARQFGKQQPSMDGIALDLAQAAAYMENHYSEEITVAQLARMANVSARHFTRCFTQVYHATPLQYLQLVRLQRACALLHEAHLSISEVSATCGFVDSNYFSRLFRQHYQQTPTQYRRTIEP